MHIFIFTCLATLQNFGLRPNTFIVVDLQTKIRLHCFFIVPVSPVMFATTSGMLPPSPLPPIPVQPILPLQPVTLPMEQIIPYHHLIPKDNSEEPSTSQNQT